MTATPEQLPIISRNELGAEVIRGAAGSGKTSTALLRLRSLLYMFEARRRRMLDRAPVRVLVLTFNRTLAGYIESLANSQVTSESQIEIRTFAKWAANALRNPKIFDRESKNELLRLARNSDIDSLSDSYILKEVDYLLGRFPPDSLDGYLSAERTGRGAQPRVDRATRRKILDQVVTPYLEWLEENKALDWNGLAVEMARTSGSLNYDIIVVDESQDFSANQLRAIRRHLADAHAITFVIDTAQRIYARGFTWVEAGFQIRSDGYHTLAANHRNTKQIAAFAQGILQGMSLDSDGALPNLDRAEREGRIPDVLRGLFRHQLQWAIDYIDSHVNLADESVAFLFPQAGDWLDYIRSTLQRAGLSFVDVTREPEWPEGPENIALCTFHSAKGLEFDHVFILGLSAQNTDCSGLDFDDEILVLRRLLAVAVARAREHVVLGYKPGEESQLVGYFEPSTFNVINVP